MGWRLFRGGRAAAVVLAMAVAAPVAVLAQQVFTDDFSDPSTGWTVRADDGPVRIDYADGQYWMYATQPVGVVLGSSGIAFNDGVISVETQDLPNSAPHVAGIFLRAQNAANFYGFVLGSDGSIGMFHYVDGTYVADGPTNLYLREGLYRTDEPNLLTVTASGSTLTYFVNGEQVASVDLVRWTGGVAGVMIGTNSPDPAGTAFDNWRLEIVQ